jgi:hypothetical protein
MKAMDISEVARRSGVPTSALRNYEEKRLIHSVGRRGLHRLFDSAVFAFVPYAGDHGSLVASRIVFGELNFDGLKPRPHGTCRYLDARRRKIGQDRQCSI